MITVRNLVKHFGPKVAVNDVSFSVERGVVLGFLGPNGAGKSTTMRMITGYLMPTAGTVKVGGHDIVDEPIEAKKLIGYLPENAPSYGDMTVGAFLTWAAEMRGVAGPEIGSAVRKAVEMTFLQPVVGQSIETLSKGYRHRVALAQALVHDPQILILDEPTDGLDPNQKHEVRQLIRRLSEKKVIIFSTHILEEVEAVCSRAIIIDRGRIVADGTPAQLKGRSDSAGVVFLKASKQSVEKVAAALEKLAESSGVTKDEETGGLRVFPKSGLKTGDLARAVLALSQRENWELDEFHVEQGNLDDVFRKITLPDTVAARGRSKPVEATR